MEFPFSGDFSITRTTIFFFLSESQCIPDFSDVFISVATLFLHVFKILFTFPPFIPSITYTEHSFNKQLNFVEIEFVVVVVLFCVFSFLNALICSSVQNVCLFIFFAFLVFIGNLRTLNFLDIFCINIKILLSSVTFLYFSTIFVRLQPLRVSVF